MAKRRVKSVNWGHVFLALFLAAFLFGCNEKPVARGDGGSGGRQNAGRKFDLDSKLEFIPRPGHPKMVIRRTPIVKFEVSTK